jgi:hypothetical protein
MTAFNRGDVVVDLDLAAKVRPCVVVSVSNPDHQRNMAVKLNIDTSAVGRAVLCPPPLAIERVLICHDGAHGVTRPTCPNVD